MYLQARVPFGNFKPGDRVEVPDGVLFDHSVFEQVAEVEAATEQPPVTIISAQGEVS